MGTDEAAPEQAKAIIDEAERVAVLTGAGISTDSRIPDFRGPQGVWTKNPKAEKMATIQHYVAERDVRVRAWRSRLDSPVWSAEPNEGHRALVELERRRKLGLLITQNIDGLHHAAGSDPDRIVDCVAAITRQFADGAPIECPADYQIENTSQRVVRLIWGTAKLAHRWQGIMDLERA